MTPTDLYDDRFDFRGLAWVKIWVFFFFFLGKRWYAGAWGLSL